jgi:hypothetical protein
LIFSVAGIGHCPIELSFGRPIRNCQSVSLTLLTVSWRIVWGQWPAMTATYVLIAFAGGVVMGAVIVLIATRRHAVDRQILDQVQRIGAVFANTAQRGLWGSRTRPRVLAWASTQPVRIR